MMKFLVLGCNGMAGHLVSLYLKEKGHDVVGFARTENPNIKTIVGDVSDFEKLNLIISSGDYDVIVNCIGILNQVAENNKANAVLINSLLPHHLAEQTKNTKTKVVHMSTDCVFSGHTGPYTETSLPDATTFYGRSKSLGEIVDDKNITIRTSIIGPDLTEKGIGLFNWFMKQSGEINGFTKAIWTGITTYELAKLIEVVSQDEKAVGLINFVNNTSISKYDLLGTIAKVFGINIKINPNADYDCDKTLLRTNMSVDYQIPSYETMIKEMKEWIEGHKELYPHYKEKLWKN